MSYRRPTWQPPTYAELVAPLWSKGVMNKEGQIKNGPQVRYTQEGIRCPIPNPNNFADMRLEQSTEKATVNSERMTFDTGNKTARFSTPQPSNLWGKSRAVRRSTQRSWPVRNGLWGWYHLAILHFMIFRCRAEYLTYHECNALHWHSMAFKVAT